MAYVSFKRGLAWPKREFNMHAAMTHESARTVVHRGHRGHGGLSNRQLIARYDDLIERAQERADEARSLAVRRSYLNLILRLQKRALRELDRGR